MSSTFWTNLLKKSKSALQKKTDGPMPITSKIALEPTSEEEMKGIAEQLGIRAFDNLSSIPIDRAVCKKVPYSFVKRYVLLPLEEKEKSVTVAVSDLYNFDALEELRFRLKKQIEPIFVPRQAIINAIHEYFHQDDEAAVELIAHMKKQNEDDFETGGEIFDLLDGSQELPPAVRLINYSILEAIQQGASDIHFEPQENALCIRYRIDGVLQNRLSPSQEIQAQLLTRLKVMSKMDIAEKRLPQDGRIKMRVGGKEIDFRVSTLPTVTGERIVLRILDKGNIVLGLDQIGMPEKTLLAFRSEIRIPEGIILVTGPTGSGKTTTLYSALTELKDEHTNIMTIEDPVEYRLKGVAQMGVHPKIGLTFAAGLRHILRQDPDIIMIGEIRDRETAEIAIQAALTGHLVLSTLHTNDAPSAVVRLADMGIEPYLISSCMIGIMAQRLVRKICTHCKETYTPSKIELDNIHLSQSELSNHVLYRGKGCPQCMHTGYQGRVGVYEHMSVNAEVRKQVLKSPESTEIKRVAQANGMLTLRDHGKQLVCRGITTLEEVWRVTRAEEEIISVVE